MIQLSHPYMIIGKTLTLTIWTFVGKVMPLLFNMLSRLVITFLPRRKDLFISWLQSPSAVILAYTHYSVFILTQIEKEETKLSLFTDDMTV